MSSNDSKKGSAFEIGQINNFGNGTTNFINGDAHQVYNFGGKQSVSVDEFTQLLKEIERVIKDSQVDQTTKVKIQKDIQASIEEGQSEVPQKGIVLAHIERALNLVQSLGGAVAATQTMLPLLTRAYDWAQKLF